MRYAIKDIFNTLQGEGARAGTRAVFVRFTGCNLWSGDPLHRDRGVGPCAKWCDTDFFKGSVLGLDALLARMGELWDPSEGARWCVLTGGEPALQIDRELIGELHRLGWKVAVETNGTEQNDAVLQCDWICVAPKVGTDWKALGAAHELKIVLPGVALGDKGWSEEELLEIETFATTSPGPQHGSKPLLFVQPQDPLVASDFVEQTRLKRTIDIKIDRQAALDLQWEQNLRRCIDWVMRHPNWRLSVQTHKFIDLP